MNYLYLIQKHIVKISALVAVVIALSIAFFLFTSPAEEESVGPATDDSITQHDLSMRVFIKDFNQLQDPTAQNLRKRIENRLYNRVSDNGSKVDLYIGIIREGSYSRESSGGVSTVRFLVDVKPINETYHIAVTTLQENSSIIVSCPPQQQQIDRSTECKDPEYT